MRTEKEKIEACLEVFYNQPNYVIQWTPTKSHYSWGLAGPAKTQSMLCKLLDILLDEDVRLDTLYEPFSKPCRFSGFCTVERLYKSCAKDKRVKNNWMCWRDGIMKENNGSEDTITIHKLKPKRESKLG